MRSKLSTPIRPALPAQHWPKSQQRVRSPQRQLLASRKILVIAPPLGSLVSVRHHPSCPASPHPLEMIGSRSTAATPPFGLSRRALPSPHPATVRSASNLRRWHS